MSRCPSLETKRVSESGEVDSDKMTPLRSQYTRGGGTPTGGKHLNSVPCPASTDTEYGGDSNCFFRSKTERKCTSWNYSFGSISIDFIVQATSQWRTKIKVHSSWHKKISCEIFCMSFFGYQCEQSCAKWIEASFSFAGDAETNGFS